MAAAHWYYNFALRECAPSALERREVEELLGPVLAEGRPGPAAVQGHEAFNDGFLTTAAQQGAGSSAGLVANHKAAMELMGAWDPGVIASLTKDEKPLPDLGWFPFRRSPAAPASGLDPRGVDGYSCSQAPRPVRRLPELHRDDAQQTAYYKAYNSPPVNTEAQSAVSEPYLKDVVKAYNAAPFVSQWLDTVYGQNVGNALNVSVVNLLAGKGDAAGIVKTTNDAAKKG